MPGNDKTTKQPMPQPVPTSSGSMTPVGAASGGELLEILVSERPGLLQGWQTRLFDFFAPLVDQTAILLERERDCGVAFHFVPVFLGLGIIVYFCAPAEPVLAIVIASAVLLFIAAKRQTIHGPGYFAAMAIALVLGGMAAGQIRSQRAGGPVIAIETTARLSALVLGAETNRKGGVRYLLRPMQIEGVASDKLPFRLRLTAVSRHQAIKPGDMIEGTARLQPFSGPAFPGGHDFGFYNWFDGLGATGFFMGAPSRAATEATASMAERALAAMNRLRGLMSQRIRDAVPGEAGDICAALITGERIAVDEATEESFRRSGLAHILSISGLHMALVTIAVVAGLRFVLSFSARLTLHYPVRKWAVAAGFASATFYLFLSGAEVATQRSYLMIAIMLAAMLADRRAMTLRNVAMAALVILCLTPEAVLEPGFQMSFAATGALVAGYGGYADFNKRRAALNERKRRSFGLAGTLAKHLGGLAATSLLAGFATGLFAVWHFHRIAPMGLFANLAAMPLTSFAVMPLALLSVLLMPYGLEAIALKPMGLAVDGVVAISNWVNQVPLADGTGKQPLSLLLAGTAGLLVLIGLNTRLRWLGLVPLAIMPLLYGTVEPPDLIVSQNGRAIGLRDSQGNLALLYPGKDRFITGIWQRAWPANGIGDTKSLVSQCDKERCAAKTPKGVRIEIIYKPELLKAACETADILIAPRLRYVNCKAAKPALVLKRGDFETSGTHMIAISGKAGKAKFKVTTSIKTDNRPWNLARRPLQQPDNKPAVNTGGSSQPGAPVLSPGPG